MVQNNYSEYLDEYCLTLPSCPPLTQCREERNLLRRYIKLIFAFYLNVTFSFNLLTFLKPLPLTPSLPGIYNMYISASLSVIMSNSEGLSLKIIPIKGYTIRYYA
jgi:hypothetical protein